MSNKSMWKLQLHALFVWLISCIHGDDCDLSGLLRTVSIRWISPFNRLIKPTSEHLPHSFMSECWLSGSSRKKSTSWPLAWLTQNVKWDFDEDFALNFGCYISIRLVTSTELFMMTKDWMFKWKIIRIGLQIANAERDVYLQSNWLGVLDTSR